MAERKRKDKEEKEDKMGGDVESMVNMKGGCGERCRDKNMEERG